MTTVAALLLPAPAAFAAGPAPEDTVTWMVRPSDGAGEDGRSWVELELDPGEVAQEHLLIRNLSRDTVTFRITAADGYFTDTGRFNMLTSDQESTGAGTWIELAQDAVEVDPGEDVIVPFTVTVPDDATPGDHPAGVAASIRSGEDAEVGIESRVGFRVMTRVTGDLAPAVAGTAAGGFTGSVNPFEPGTLTVEYTLTNSGNTRLTVTPVVTAAALFGVVSFSASGEPIVEIAPGETRSGTVTFPSTWPLFAYAGHLEATATALTPTGDAADDVSLVASATGVIPAVPWSQLITLGLIALIIWWLWRDRRRRQQKIDDLIERAREEERAQARGDTVLQRVRFAPALLAVVLALDFAATPAAALDLPPGSDSVSISVEITPAPTPSATVPSSSTAVGDGLPRTGAVDATPLVATALTALALGTALVLSRALGRRPLQVPVAAAGSRSRLARRSPQAQWSLLRTRFRG